MKRLLAIIILLTMVAGAVTPLDLLKPCDAPVSKIDLCNVSSESAKAMGAINNITKWEYTPMQDLGKYFFGTKYETQYNGTLSTDLKNWSDQYVPITPSIQSI